MKKLLLLAFCLAILLNCSSNVRFIQTDASYVISPKNEHDRIVFKHEKINRPHTVIGVIQAYLDKQARRPQLDALMISKAREIGADGLMLVEYNIDRDVYLEKHHRVVGRGPWRRHVVATHPRHVVKKSASAIAVVFESGDKE